MLCVKGYGEEFNGEETLKFHIFYCDFKDEGRVPCQLCEDIYGLWIKRKGICQSMHAWQSNLHDLHRPVSMRDISKLAAYLGDLQQKIII